MSSLLQNLLQLDAPDKLSAWSSPLKAASGNIISPKSFIHWRWERSWFGYQHEEGDPNDGYAVTIKTNATRTVQIKCDNNLSSFQLHFHPNDTKTSSRLN